MGAGEVIEGGSGPGGTGLVLGGSSWAGVL